MRIPVLRVFDLNNDATNNKASNMRIPVLRVFDSLYIVIPNTTNHNILKNQ